MILVLLASSLSLGLQAERSAGISEPGIPLGIVLRSEPDGWRGEALWSSADKDQGTVGSIAQRQSTGQVRPGGERFDSASAPTPCCWRTSLTLDREAGPLIAGAGWTHRDAAAWTKDRAWLRAGARWRGARLILRSALTSRDRESDVEASATLHAGRLAVEPAYGWTLFDQGSTTPNRRWASHASLLLLWRLGKGVRNHTLARSVVHEPDSSLHAGGLADGR